MKFNFRKRQRAHKKDSTWPMGLADSLKETDKLSSMKFIKIGEFNAMYIASKPPRLEAKIIFGRDHISQKFIFTLMSISHRHGFGCSAPYFSNSDDPNMVFFIGSALPNAKSLKKYSKRLDDCLCDLMEFIQEFTKQLDFSVLDLSMFKEMEIFDFYPEQFAATRDQHYDGSWSLYKESLESQDRVEEAQIVECCAKFEEKNNKDIGFVGHKLSDMLQLLEMATFDLEGQKN